MSFAYYGLLNEALTVEVDDRLKLRLGLDADELTVRLFDFAIPDGALKRESWYLDRPSTGPAHRKADVAHGRFERFKKDAETALGVVATLAPAEEGIANPVWVDLTHGLWHHGGLEDVPGDLLGELVPNKGRKKRKTRRKWRLIGARGDAVARKD